MRRIVASVLCLLLSFQSFLIVNAETSDETLPWILSSISLEHKSVSFRISGVESAQQAVLNITNEDGSTNIDIPFQITSAIQDVILEIPGDEFLAYDAMSRYGTSYSLCVKDIDGRKTRTYSQQLYSCAYYFWADAYPEMILSSYTTSATTITATVGFEEYTAAIDQDRYVMIDYPAQEIGTVISVKYGDEYGCQYETTITVQNEELRFPEIYVWRDSVTAYYSTLEDDERLVVDVGGTKYYSEYGLEYEILNNYVTYPSIDKSISTVKVCVESTNGSKSEEKEYDIKDCEIEDCVSASDYDVYLSKTIGTVKENSYKHTISSVSTEIDGKEYSCKVDENGTFELVYPEQDEVKKLNIVFKDEHGCVYEREESVTNRLSYVDEIYCVLFPKKAIAECIRVGMCFCIEIDGTVYKSNYATSSYENVEVTYPTQEVGKTARVWYEMQDSSKTSVATVTIGQRKYSINNLKAKTKSVTGRISLDDYEYEYGDYTVSVIAGGKEYECVLDNNKFSATYPKQKVGSKIQIIIEDTDGSLVQQEYTLKNIPPKLKVNKVVEATKAVTGKSVAGSKVKVTIGGKKYSGRVKANGKFSIRTKKHKKGAKVKVSVTTSEGYTKTKTVRVKKSKKLAAQRARKRAKAAKAKKKRTTSSNTNTTSSGTVYITPYGERYHLDPDCGGKNSRPTSYSSASYLGPCAKCAS